MNQHAGLTTFSLKIQDLAEEDRPREKLLNKGVEALTTAELLAVIIGSGTKNISAVSLAQHILKSNENSLQELAKRSVKELQRFKGIGKAKAIALVCAMELTRRKAHDNKPDKGPLNSSYKAYSLVQADLADKLVEEFWILLLNSANYLIKKLKLSSGGTSITIADPKVLFKLALEYNASGIILVHNHPILDHIIFTDKTYFSFADDGFFHYRKKDTEIINFSHKTID